MMMMMTIFTKNCDGSYTVQMSYISAFRAWKKFLRPALDFFQALPTLPVVL